MSNKFLEDEECIMSLFISFFIPNTISSDKPTLLGLEFLNSVDDINDNNYNASNKKYKIT